MKLTVSLLALLAISDLLHGQRSIGWLLFAALAYDFAAPAVQRWWKGARSSLKEDLVEPYPRFWRFARLVALLLYGVLSMAVIFVLAAILVDAGYLGSQR